MKSEKARQAAYAAKNRQKSKSIGRPDARAVAEAYVAAVEGGGLEKLLHIYISKLAPEADSHACSRQVIEMVRSLVRVTLFERGFNDQQVRDKMKSMRTD